MKTNRIESRNYVFKVIHGKKAAGFANSYYYSLGAYGFRGISQAYARPSEYKRNAFNGCFDIIRDFVESCEFEGDELYYSRCTVVSANCQKFTFACEIIDSETGEIVGIIYITADYNYFIPASEF